MSVSLKIRNKIRISTLTTSMHNYTGGSTQFNKARKIKASSMKRKKQSCILRRHNCLCRKSVGIYKKLIELMSLKRLQDTQSIYRNQLHVCIPAIINQQSKVKAILFLIISLDNMTFLGINLTTGMQPYTLKAIKQCWEKLKKT